MYIYLAKILPLLVLPIGIVIELSLVAYVLLRRNSRKKSAVVLGAAMLVLWVSSMPVVGDALLGRLERAYPAVMMSEVPVSKCIVVLGGAVEPVQPPRIDVDMGEAVDRVRKAAQLFRAGRGELIIVSGGNQPWSPFKQTEAEAIRTLLLEWGVPDAAIVLEQASRNTRENALNSFELMREQACRNPLLVTSAAHMKRSVAVFAKLGINVVPVSADVRVVNKPELTLLDFLPDADALKMTSDAMREWVGQWVYWVKGWN